MHGKQLDLVMTTQHNRDNVIVHQNKHKVMEYEDHNKGRIEGFHQKSDVIARNNGTTIV